MRNKLPGDPRFRPGRRALLACLLGVGLVATSWLPIDEQALLHRFADDLGGRVVAREARLDLLRAGGIVVDDVEIRIESWRLQIPRLTIRPSLGALLEGRLEPSASAAGFSIVAEGANGPEAFRRLAELIDVTAIPDWSIRLRDGVIRTRSGQPLLRDVTLAFEPKAQQVRVTLEAHQADGGRLDVAGYAARAKDALRLDIFFHRLESPLLADWIGLPARREAFSGASVRVSGRWHLALGSDGRTEHEVSLQLAARSPRGSGGGGVSGRLTVSGLHPTWTPGEGFRVERQILPGAFFAWNGTIARIRTADTPELPTLLVSGPISGSLVPTGSIHDPRLDGEIELGSAYLRAGTWLHKATGSNATLRFTSRPLNTVRSTELRLDLEGWRVEGRFEAGVLTAKSDWIRLERLAVLAPPLRNRVGAGRIRLASLKLRSPDEFALSVDIEDGSLRGPRIPSDVSGVSGRLDLTSTGLEARGLAATLEGTPWILDLEVRPGRALDDAPFWIRFAAHARKLTLDLGGPRQPAPDPTAPAPLLRTLAAAVATPIGFLRQHRSTLEAIHVEHGLIHADHVQVGSASLQALRIELSMERLALSLDRVSFLEGSASHRFSARVDLKPLVPALTMASLP